MSSVAAQYEMFPDVVASLPKAERTVWDEYRDYLKLQDEIGDLVPPTLAATLLGINHSRVNALCEEGRFRRFTFFGKTWLCEEDIVAYASSERQGGRPIKGASVKEIWAESRRWAKEQVNLKWQHRQAMKKKRD